MAEATNQSELQMLMAERYASGTSITNNDSMEKNGYIIEKNLWDPEELYHPVPRDRGTIFYYGSIDKFQTKPEDGQVPGALSRHSHPQYKSISHKVRKKIEDLLKVKLYSTFYYDRFYFSGQALPKHIETDACEIGVRINVSSNLTEPWPLMIKTPDIYADNTKETILVPGEEKSINLEPGDALIYKSCERPLWSNPLPDSKNKRKIFGKKEEFYYHQLVFNYVLSNGQRSHITV
tara:strand:- start:515 stop:1219 length:705 start_codon:yes stop_codon:yes gene_type:complete